jgi:hypothetical protein
VFHGVNMNGTIATRKTKDGQTRYRAQIKINRAGIKFTESRTFSKRSLASEWLEQRTAEIERNPDILGSGSMLVLCVCHADEQSISTMDVVILANAGIQCVST